MGETELEVSCKFKERHRRAKRGLNRKTLSVDNDREGILPEALKPFYTV